MASSKSIKPFTDMDELRVSFLMARHPTKKGARYDDRYRPKKAKQNKPNQMDSTYVPHLNDFEDLPPEYTSVPVPEVLNLLLNSELYQVMEALHQKVDYNNLAKLNNRSDIHNLMSQFNQLASQNNDTISHRVYNHLKTALETQGKKPELDPLTPLALAQKSWSENQKKNYEKLLQKKFFQLQNLILQLKELGSAIEQLEDPETWIRYGLFKDLPSKSYVEKFTFAHNNSISTNNLSDSFIANEFKRMGIIDNYNQNALNFSKLNELKNQASTYQYMMSLRDNFYSRHFPHYSPVSDKYKFELYLEAPYRQNWLIYDLSILFKDWANEGFQKPSIPLSQEKAREKFAIMSTWKSTSKKRRKFLILEYKKRMSHPFNPSINYTNSPSNVTDQIKPITLYTQWNHFPSGIVKMASGTFDQPFTSNKPLPQPNKKPKPLLHPLPKETEFNEDTNIEITETSSSHGDESSYAYSAQVVVFKDASYNKSSFTHSLESTVPGMTLKNAENLWSTLNSLQKVVVFKSFDRDLAENIAMMLRKGNPPIWADIEDL